MSARERLVLDVTVLVAVLAAANPAITGIALHEWVGIVLTVPALVHLVVNWDWVVRTVVGFLGKIRAASRVNLAVDAALFIAVVGVTLSGFLVIPGLAASLGLQASPFWHAVHLATSDLTVALMVGHVVLHARWIAQVMRRWSASNSAPSMLGAPMGRPATPFAGTPARAVYVPNPAERR